MNNLFAAFYCIGISCFMTHRIVKHNFVFLVCKLGPYALAAYCRFKTLQTGIMPVLAHYFIKVIHVEVTISRRDLLKRVTSFPVSLIKASMKRENAKCTHHDCGLPTRPFFIGGLKWEMSSSICFTITTERKHTHTHNKQRGERERVRQKGCGVGTPSKTIIEASMASNGWQNFFVWT